ncbi:Wzz/FepE/Etk N-terminal domain-containing protein, partial [Parabacteroides goldsteinii]|uniref:Wzz/FepE/Etk N-terminal domain-containing protein n=1 Tax=Parabacteroides goldsteinii TaxID=328812 RepID=UPI0025B6A0FA
MIQMNTPDTDNAQEIDLIELAKRLWGERKFIFKCCGIAVVVGLVVAFSIPKEYSTTVKLAPETSDPSKKMGNLGGLAAMAGINLNSTSGADAISPDLYPDVVSSIPFLLELFPVQVTNEKGNYSASLYDYMDDHQKSAWWSYVVQAPFKLLGVVKDLFSKEEPVSSGELTSFRLTKEQADVINALQERISASVDKKTSVITVSVQMQDPLISANITQIVLEKLQGYITNYRTQKVKQDLEFTAKV